MLLPAVISILAGLILVGCADDGERASLVAYHLEEHWTESAPPARFRTLTRHIARVGRRERRHHQLALVVGDLIVAVPTIDYEQSPSGIDSRVVEIAGLSSATEAEKIAEGLRGG
jgi:hypothetical protein